MKTTFSSGVIVTSAWLNGAQNIFFDGQNLDWHYPALGLSSLITTGVDGLDGRYITLGTDQPNLSSSGLYISGQAIAGAKVVTGSWKFGYDTTVVGNPANTAANSPLSYTTNTKYDAGGVTPVTKLAAMNNADLVTKQMLVDQLTELLDSLEIDNGIYYSSSSATCNNYNGGSTVICSL
jgi:hypothetical protein